MNELMGDNPIKSARMRAEVDAKHYAELASQALSDGYHNLAWEWQKKSNQSEELHQEYVRQGEGKEA
jgi:hypothetical protein